MRYAVVPAAGRVCGITDNSLMTNVGSVTTIVSTVITPDLVRLLVRALGQTITITLLMFPELFAATNRS